MRKSLFDELVKEEMISRIFQLDEHAERQWGEMDATQMLHHLNTAFKLMLSGKPKKHVPGRTVKQWVAKNLVMHVLPRMPKGVPTRSDLDVVGSRLDTNSFEEERTELIKLLNQFQRTKEIHASHPRFGKLTAREWSIFAWMHVDHHLRQFDV